MLRFLADTAGIADMELRKLRHDPIEVFTRAIQPILWLVVFGTVISRSRVIPTGGLPYLDFLTPGVLAQSALFVAIFFGIAVIWERDLGIVHKLLVSPVSRASLVLGKAFSAALRALTQVVIIYPVAAALGVRLRLSPLALVGVVVLVVLGSALFATLSLIVASLVRTRERFMGIGQLLTMPLFFASNAIYPVSLMPGWLQALARANPLSYQVDGLRALALDGGHSSFGLATDLAVLALALVVLTVIGARLYPRVAT
ncbi:MAG: ABC transporter permease [Acidimicrobiales bacterium]